jgi:hypothetical protein
MGSGGGPTYDSGANYSYQDWRYVAAGAAQSGSTGQTGIPINNPTANPLSNSASWGLCGFTKLYVPGGSAYPRTVSEVAYVEQSGVREGVSSRGAYEITTTLTAIQFLMSSGNIASGTIRVYGIAKS